MKHALSLLCACLALGAWAQDHQPSEAVHQMLSEAGKMTDAKSRLAAYEQIAQKAKASGDIYGEGEAEYRYGKTAAALQMWQPAIQWFSRAQSAYQAAKSPQDVAICFHEIGLSQVKSGHAKDAISSYQQELSIQQQLGDKAAEAITLNGLGRAYDAAGDRQQAITTYSKALPMAQEAKDRNNEAATLDNMALSYLGLKQTAQAQDALNKALPIWHELGDKRGEAITLNALADSYLASGQQDKAVDALKQAIPLWHDARDISGEESAATNLGTALFSVGKRNEAAQWFEQALAAARQAHDHWGEAAALDRIGKAYDSVGDREKALDRFNVALEIRRALNDGPGIAETLADMGLTLNAMGDRKKAAEALEESVSIREQIGDTKGQARASAALAGVYDDLGQKKKARELYDKALAMQEQSGDAAGEADTLDSIGVMYSESGNRKQAIDAFERARAAGEKLGDEALQARALANTAALYAGIGQRQKALDAYQQALDIEQKAGDKAGAAATMDSIGQVWDDLGQKRKALQYYAESLPLRQEASDRAGEANTLNNAGRIYDQLGEHDKALEYFNKALSIERSLGDKAAQSATLNNIGLAYHAMGRDADAMDPYMRALSIERSLGDRPREAKTLFNLAHGVEAQQMPALAITFAKQSVAVLETLRKDVKGLGKDMLRSYDQEVEPAYRYLAGLLIHEGRLAEAQETMDLLKQQEDFSFEHHGTTRGTTFQEQLQLAGTEKGWWDKWQALQEKALLIYKELDDLEGKEASLVEKGQQLTPEETARLKELRQQKTELDKASKAYFEAVKTDISALGDTLKQGVEAKLHQTNTLVQRLKYMRANGVNATAVYAVAAKDEIHFIVITASGYVPVSVAVSTDKLNKLVSEFRSVLMNPQQDPRPKGKELYDAVLKPVMERLKQTPSDHVMWSLDGTLRYIPISAVWDGEQYLIERGQFTMFNPLRLDVIVAPSRPDRKIAAFAATKGGPGYDPLPGADTEVKGVVLDSGKGASGAVPGHLWEDSDFTDESLRLGIRNEQNSLLHIATHFSLGKDFDSSKILLGDGKELTLKEFFDWGETQLGHVELMCLSACNTAETMISGDATGGEVESFVSLVLEQGANSVVASLWPVSDQSTPQLMQAFYKNWMQHPELGKGDALRKAQLALLYGNPDGKPSSQKDAVRPFQHPYYWAPFLLFGNWK